MMIILNGSKFAEKEDEAIESLFTDKTISGYAKRFKRKIDLFDLQKNRIGCINRHNVLLNAYKMDNGKTWYTFANINQIGQWNNYSKERDELEALVIARDKIGAIYK